MLSSRFSARNKITMDIYGDHLLYSEKGLHRIRRHDAQVRLLARDLAKAARHPVVEERPLGRHRERPEIYVLGIGGGTELLDVTICHLLSQAWIRDVVENSTVEGSTNSKTFQIRQHAPSGRNRVQPATCTLVNTRWVASGRTSGVMLCCNYYCCKGTATFSPAVSILFQRQAALLVTNNALCPMSGQTPDT